MQVNKIIILCLNWNGCRLLKKSIPSLKNNLKNLKQINYEIFIRDNGSSDQSINYLNENHSDVNLLEINHNRDSFSVGVNSLFNLAKPNDKDVILLLNNDIEFKDDKSLYNMINVMNETGAAVVGARLLYKNGNISHNGIIFSPKYGNMPWHYREGKRSRPFDLCSREFQAVTAACCLIKVKNFKAAGGLNENLKWAFEDVDMNLEISINQKEKVICCGSTNIIHLTSASLKKNPVNKLFLNKNVKYFKKKWFGKYSLDHDKYLNDSNYKLIK